MVESAAKLLIAKFAHDNGLRLRFYRDGLCAILDKESKGQSGGM
jgi:hypothetical protein